MTGFRNCLLYPALFLFCLQRAAAQEHSYEHFDVHDGLAGSTVYSMAQDKDGFIWFGTESGLSRFDGTHFVNFTTRDGLPDNEILKVYVDRQNRVWTLPFRNTIAYYYKGVFHTAQNDTTLRKLIFDREVTSIGEDTAGNILLMANRYMYIISPAGQITNVKEFHYEGIYYNYLRCGLNKDHRFRVNATRFGAVMVCDIYGDKMVPVKIMPATRSQTPLVNLISPDLEIYEEKRSILFFSPRDSSSFRIPLPNGIISISRVNDSIAILNTYTNTFLFNIRQKKITDSFLQGRTVNAALEDSEGNLWFSTLGEGIYRLGSLVTRNYVFKQQNNVLPVFSITKLDSFLYFGSEHFFMGRLDLRTGSLKSATLYQSTTRGKITCMVRLRNGKTVIGTDLGLQWFHGIDSPATEMRFAQSIKSLSVVGDSLLLKTSNSMADLFRLSNNINGEELYSARASCGYYDSSNESFFIGTLNGLYFVDKDRHRQCLGDRFKELASRITAIDKAPDGVLWVATENGLAGYYPGRPLVYITEKNGLTSNICRSLFLSDGRIWVGTEKGLNKVSFADGDWRVVSYSMADGLNSDMINAIYVQGSEVYAGTSEGVSYFDENKMSKRSDCLLRITGITVSEKKLPTDSSGFHLPHANNNIKFDFVGISYKSAGSILYRYKLIGFDTSWVTTRETFLSYLSLPSGSYELQIVAINKFGLESQQISIPFFVDKLIWEKGWFRVLFIFAIALAIMFVFNYRVRRIRKKESEKSETVRKIAELEQMALRSQMNPHFIFNCLNSIQEYVLYKDVLGVNEFITKFSNLIRKTLHISNQPFISLEEEIEYISTYLDLEKKRFENKFIYEIAIGEEVDIYRCVIPPMILQPYLENAIRHGIGLRPDKSGRISVRMSYGEGALICVVEDNGIGRKQAAKFKSVNAINYQSFGMRLVERRLAMLNQDGKGGVVITIDDLEDGSGRALGTRITLQFPLSIVLE